MPNINITVADKIATNMSPGVAIVCGNNDYTVTFAFDAEWAAHGLKTARFVYTRDGKVLYTETVFAGTVAAVPVLSNVQEVYVGVYAGDLHTTTPARVLCDRSILCGGGSHEAPPEDIYNQILALCNEIAGASAAHLTDTDNPHKTTAQQTGARPDDWMPSAADVGARPDTWTPSAADVGARPDTWTPSAADVGARPDTWTPSAADVGARPNTWTPTAAQVGARPDTWLPTIAEIGAAPAGYVDATYSVSNFDGLLSTVNTVLSTMDGRKYAQLAFSVSDWSDYIPSGEYLATVYKEANGYGLLTVKCNSVQLQNRLYNGTWEGFEWVNPPMTPGVEYRTTERWNGLPVYTMLINCGSMPTAGNTNRIEMPSNINGRIDKVLRVTGTDSSGNSIPYSWQGEYITEVSASRAAIYIYAKDDYSNNTAYVQIWYTRQ